MKNETIIMFILCLVGGGYLIYSGIRLATAPLDVLWRRRAAQLAREGVEAHRTAQWEKNARYGWLLKIFFGLLFWCLAFMGAVNLVTQFQSEFKREPTGTYHHFPDSRQ